MRYDPICHTSVDPALDDILALIQTSFASMQGRIDPPSSMYRLTLATISKHCKTGEVWSIGTPPFACIFLTSKPRALYLGKLAVAHDQRGKGHARSLITLAERRALALGKLYLELETRVELIENHQIFAGLGFEITAEAAHPGYDHPTFIEMRKPVGNYA